MPPPASNIGHQLFWLLILSIPVAAISRTVVFEEVLREAREWCQGKSQSCNSLFARKFFYLFTCEYCFSHYVTLFFLILTRFRLLLDDWRGSVIAWFAIVFVANAYLNLYARLRIDITSQKKEIEATETHIKKMETEIEANVTSNDLAADGTSRSSAVESSARRS